MALSSSLFSGISGLSSLGEAMQVVGDNIANVNTVGFKSSTYTFQDLLSQAVATQAGTSQVGKGTTLSDIYQTFSQGSFETTSSTTDLAIGGSGFFELREPESTNMFLSRAGNFRFDKDGYLVNPEGYVVQGWELNDDGEDVGDVTDIRLDSFSSPPPGQRRAAVDREPGRARGRSEHGRHLGQLGRSRRHPHCLRGLYLSIIGQGV